MWRALVVAAVLALSAAQAVAQPYGAVRMLPGAGSPNGMPPRPAGSSFPMPGMGVSALPGTVACRAAITAAERAYGIPDRLMAAIGMVESARRDPQTGQVGPWPWTINAEGAGGYYETKAEAVAAVRDLQARGVRSIDVGCMQINLFHHASAFANLEEAFDPAANARYAARYLTTLMGQTGSWQKAAAWYHSANPEFGEPYARKVMAAWSGQQSLPAAPDVQVAGYGASGSLPSSLPSLRPGPAVSGSMTFAGSTTARIIPLASGSQLGGATATARSLDSYRANPTQLAAQFLPLRPRS